MRAFFHQMKLITASLLLGMTLTYAFAAPVAAEDGAAGRAKTDVCQGVTLGGGTCDGGGTDIQRVIAVVLQILSIVAGVAAVIMLIIGGMKYITSNGDASGISSAKNTIIYALVGLVIVAFAQLIVRYVLGRATGRS